MPTGHATEKHDMLASLSPCFPACLGVYLKALLAVVVCVLSVPAIADGPPKPKFHIANPGKCIAPLEKIRRDHPDMLQHQRDRTTRQGIRGESAGLKACVNCHAGKSSNSVLGKGEFCESCHSYAAVKVDCFGCHSSKRQQSSAAAPYNSMDNLARNTSRHLAHIVSRGKP